MTRPRLGKGLGALIPTASAETEKKHSKGRTIIDLPIRKIQANPMQPRRKFDQQKLESMAETIGQYGIIQPIIVVENDGLYTIVAGERRFRAAILAGLKTVPAEIKGYNKEQYTEIALIENLQREDLNPIEEATAYQKLIEEFNLTQEEVAKKIGRSRSAISNAMRLLMLPEDIKENLVSGKITPGQVRPILALKDSAEQIAYAAKIIDENLTARQVEKIFQEKNILPQKKKKEQKKEKDGDDRRPAILKEMEDSLRRFLGTKVLIRAGLKESKIEISFYNDEDLERLLQLLLK